MRAFRAGDAFSRAALAAGEFSSTDVLEAGLVGVLGEVFSGDDLGGLAGDEVDLFTVDLEFGRGESGQLGE